MTKPFSLADWRPLVGWSPLSLAAEGNRLFGEGKYAEASEVQTGANGKQLGGAGLAEAGNLKRYETIDRTRKETV